MKPLKDETGAAIIIELILVVAVLTLAGLAVYQQMHAKPSVALTSPIPQPARVPSRTPAPNPYAGWRTFTLKYEKISLKYPPSWTLKDDTANCQNTNSQGQLLYAPGSDCISLTAPDSLFLTVATAPAYYDAGGPQSVLFSQPIAMLGTTDYLNFDTVSSNCASCQPQNAGFYIVTKPTATDTFPLTKNITFGPGSKSPSIQSLLAPYILIGLNYTSPTTANNHDPLAKYQQDPQFKTAISILRSMQYVSP